MDLNESFNDPTILSHRHWWSFISEHFGNKFDSIKYVMYNDTKDGEKLTIDELGFRWIILALFKIEDIQGVLCQLFNETDFLMLYDKETSFLWNDREAILDAIEHLKDLDLNSPFYKSDVLD